ncbi:MFS transporter [Arthrobacter burdickii]|uniref:MFS transporter n=1 Tax=Arthrobacter burdickii TaxID=3035920 RepID=A0ABT8K2D6_9MICC|nr:MFS transporter [Arthrobacter burdickii]MDN4611575.1 MFS transporter [Arthrobacter burdickii]
MSSLSSRPSVGPATAKSRRLGLALLVVASAQLMLVLDDSIANIALPSIQIELGISPASLPWVINAYILAFGGLLLFGGRLGDLFGRRRILQIGIGLFTLSSLVAGIAPAGPVLGAARAIQGLGAALTAPNALALITTTFPAGEARNKALAVYGAMSGLGVTVGLLLGGVLTGTLGWRWVFFINLPIGLALLAGTRILVDAPRHAGRLDLPGAVAGTGGVAAIVFAIIHGGEQGWDAPMTLIAFGLAAVLLPAFVIIESRSKDPMLPLRLFRDRNRTGSYLGMLFISFGPMGTFYLLTLHMQHILEYDPVRTGLAWLPFGAGIILSAGIASKLVVRFAPRVVAVSGILISTVAILWLSTITPDSGYARHLMLGIFAVAVGFGLSFVPLTLTAVTGIRPDDSGIASALLNAAQQIGVALGIAALSTMSVTTTESRFPNALTTLREARSAGDTATAAITSQAVVDGYTTALSSGAIILAAAALIVTFLVTARPERAVEPS